jgi:GNAT superfamily N-acetyltransferase
MMDGIAKEYAEPISGPQSVRMLESYRLPGQRYWVALDGERVVGTVGLILLGGQNAVLKRMMTDGAYRGAATGLARKLLATAVEWGGAQGSKTIYLGTMAQFSAAQRFYLKHGCEEVPVQDLPADMPVNPIDVIYYRLSLPVGMGPL